MFRRLPNGTKGADIGSHRGYLGRPRRRKLPKSGRLPKSCDENVPGYPDVSLHLGVTGDYLIGTAGVEEVGG